MMRINTPGEMYASILIEVDKLIQSLQTHIESEEIERAQNDAQVVLNGIQNEVETALLQLQEKAEWDVFSIAFYGETNAGKSTLIETLRIILGEPSKAKQRERFEHFYERNRMITNHLSKAARSLKEISHRYHLSIDTYNKQLREIQGDALEEISKCVQDMDILRLELSINRKSSILSFIKSLFGVLYEQKEIKRLRLRIVAREAYLKSKECELSAIKDAQKISQADFSSEARTIKESMKHLKCEQEEISKELMRHSDGEIIGNGQSDFTQVVTKYSFEHNGQQFALLDLPGIEGNESKVLTQINDAVQTAHAVFYINNKPTPPQTGSEGTLEKIKKHLGQQTEVYAIYNKRVNNPHQLEPELINSDEKTTLLELDQVMQKSLGEHYIHNFSLSAYPAFLSVANCWRNYFNSSKEKFIRRVGSAENLLNLSRVGVFSEWIVTSLIDGCKAKIKRSNYRKVSETLAVSIRQLGDVYLKFQGLETYLIKEKNAVDVQMDESALILELESERVIHTSINKFKTNLRKAIYAEIDKEIDNEVFKNILERKSKDAVTKLATTFENRLNEVIEKFSSDIENIVEKYHRYIHDLVQPYENVAYFDFDFNLSIDTKSGVNWAGAITSVVSGFVGVIVCLVNPMGWVVLALSVLSFAVTAFKRIYGFFNHSYRASQQRNTADESIENTADNIEKLVKDNLRDAHEPLQAEIEKMKANLQKPINHVKIVNQVFFNVEKEFKSLIAAIERESLE